jgi:DNA-binding transcriptional regulator YdaS (Cro superfamily)
MNVNVNLELKAAIIKVFGSQLNFALELGVSELSVSQVVNSRKKLQPEEQKTWAKALKCKPAELFQV